jgi:AcrR family transcriptional regulator
VITPRPVRADAARNQAGILRAARSLIRSDGPDVGMDEIAHAAGVAVGTLYRHFPAKADLVAAIVRQIAGQLAEDLDAAVARIDQGGQARDELVSLFTRLAEIVGTDRALKLAITHLSVAHLGVAEQMRDLQQRVMATLTRIVAAARLQGSLYPDVTAGDVALLLAALPGDELPEAERQRWVELALRGLIAR